MSWRKWLVRLLVFSTSAGLALAGLVYERWTNPAAVRLQVIDKLSQQFPGATISLDSAHMRLLGGIALNDLRLTRKDDPENTDVAYFPSAVIYHDKEKLLEGTLVIRKVELHRPHLRIIRMRDGHWNVEGIIGETNLKEFIPTIAIDQGTILLEDRLAQPDTPAVEIKDVNLTLLNDPLPTVTFQGKGASDLLGALQAKATWQRRSGDTCLSLDVAGIPVSRPLVDRIGAYCAEAADHARHLEGMANLQAEIGYHPDLTQVWNHDLKIQLTRAKLTHPQLPLVLDQLEASVHCTPAEISLDSLSAVSGKARITLKGTAQAPQADTDFHGTLTIAHLPLTSSIFEGHLPANIQKINTDYHPTGPVSLTFEFERKTGHWWNRCLVPPEDLAADYEKFRYRLEHITGTIDQEIDTSRHVDVLKIDLAGYTGNRPVYIKGEVAGEGPTAAVEIKIWADDVPMDDKLMAALPAVHQEVARSFQPAGLVNVEAFIRRPGGAQKFANRYLSRFHHASIRYKEFPYPLEDVSAVLDILPDHWECRDFHGTHKGAEVRCRGRSFPEANGDKFLIEIGGLNFVVDPELKAALHPKPDLERAWTLFSPAGHMDFSARVERLPAQPPDIDVTVSANNCSIRPLFFPYLLSELNGTIRYAKRQVLVQKLRAHHGRTIMTLDEARVYLDPAGGTWTDLLYLHCEPLIPEEDLLRAMPPLLGKVCTGLGLKDPLNLRTRLIIKTSPEADKLPVIFWDGEMAMEGATLQAGVPLDGITGKVACTGTYDGRQLEGLVGNLYLNEATIFKQPFREVHTRLVVQKDEPEVLHLPNLKGQIYGGDVGGEARIEFGPMLRYELNLTATQVKLEEFGKKNLGPDTPLSGLAAARLYLRGQGTDINELSGAGSIDVPKGRLYHLPLLLDLLKVLGLRPPDGTAFEEAHAVFSIQGPRLILSRVDLYGNSFSLRGQGEMNLDGSDINLAFYAVLSRALQMLPPILKDIPQAVSKYFLKIELRGRVGDVHATKEPVPVLIDPLKELLQRMRGKGNERGQESLRDRPEEMDRSVRTPEVSVIPRQ